VPASVNQVKNKKKEKKSIDKPGEPIHVPLLLASEPIHLSISGSACPPRLDLPPPRQRGGEQPVREEAAALDPVVVPRRIRPPRHRPSPDPPPTHRIWSSRWWIRRRCSGEREPPPPTHQIRRRCSGGREPSPLLGGGARVAMEGEGASRAPWRLRTCHEWSRMGGEGKVRHVGLGRKCG
jgi:hypothetical protein